MKTKFLLPFLLYFFSFTIMGQSNQAPTLSAGLDNIAFKPGTLDVEVLTKIISEKQKEIVREGIKKVIFNTIGNSKLDDFSQFYIERITQIIFDEKNHKVMTKRILEESTNYLFVLGTTKLILDSKSNFLKQLLDSDNDLSSGLDDIDDIKLRERVIRIVLTICSEVPEIKELGLLNSFNYYEHFKIYDDQFIKAFIKDYQEIINVIKKPEEFFNNDFIKEKSEAIVLLFKNYFDNNGNIIAETETQINLKIDELDEFIEEKFKIKINEKILKKLIQNKIFTEEKFKKYRVITEAITFVKKVLSKSSILKDVLYNSGLDFNKISQSFEDIVRNYETSFDGYDSKNLIFEKINNSIANNALVGDIKELKKEIEKNYEEFKKIDFNKIKATQLEIRNRIQLFKGYRKEIDSVYNLMAGMQPDTVNKKYSISNNLKNNLKGYLGYSIGDRFIKKSDFEEIKRQLKITQNDLLNGLEIFLKIKKNDLEIRSSSLSNNVNYQKIVDLKIDNTSSSSIKELVAKIEIGKSYIDNLNTSFLLESINHNYQKVTKLYKEIREATKNEMYDNQKIISLFNFDTDTLFKAVSIKKDFNLNTIQSLSNNLDLLTGKLFVKGYSKTGDNSLFYMIKEYLVTKKINLKKNVSLTDNELSTLSKLNSFFLDRKMSERLNNLEFITFFNSKILADLLIISNKLDNTKEDSLNINKLLASIEFAISNKIITKTIESKDHLNIPHIDKLKDFLKFVGNIKEFNKAETFTFLLKTMNDYEFLFNDPDDEKKLIPDLINSLREYAIVDLENNSIEIDVASVLTHILEKYQKNRRFSFYATVGLNQYWTNTDLVDNNGNTYSNFNAASEKIGAKFKIWNFDEKPLMEDKLIHRVKRKALVSDIYAMGYVSGILYKIANTSGRDYNSANIGLAFGLTFFNSLDLNFSYSIPMEGKVFQNSLMGISFDIPLSEYLKKL